MLKGEAKKEYQRKYMRQRRIKEKELKLNSASVRPDVRPKVDADGYIIYEE